MSTQTIACTPLLLSACADIENLGAIHTTDGLVMVGGQQDKIGGLDACLRDAGNGDALIMMLDMK